MNRMSISNIPHTVNVFAKMSLTFFGLAFLSGCVAATQDVQSLQNQILTQEQTIQSLNSQLSNVQPAQADAWLQLQTLREELAIVRGQVEAMEIALRPIGGASAIGQKLAIHDRALRLTEAQMGLNLQLNQAVTTPLVNTVSPSVPSQSTLPQSITSTQPVPTQTTSQGIGISGGSSTQSQPASTQTSQTQNTAQVLYDYGLTSFNERNYQRAVNAFSDFVKTYPSNLLTPNAYYWQGESYYQLKNYAAAALAYEEVISNSPNSDKAPASYLKQGMAFAELKKPEAAKERYTQLIANYPKAPEAVRAGQLVKEL